MKKTLISVILVLVILCGFCMVKAEIPSNAKTYNGHSYKLFANTMTWTQAKLYCEKQGGHLLTITSQGELVFVVKNMKETFWIGGYLAGTQWKWVTGESMTFFFNEFLDYDEDYSEYTNQSRLALSIYPGETWAFHDDDGEKKAFICEWDSAVSTKLKDATVVLSQNEYEYTGREIKPGVTVTLSGTTLQEGTDYKITYKNNKKAGTASVKITGKGKYKGSKTVQFKINKRSIDGADIVLSKSEYRFDGTAKKPGVTVTLNGEKLKKSDYTVSYSANKLPGDAVVLVTGKGNYQGLARKNFTITVGELDNIYKIRKDYEQREKDFSKEGNAVINDVMKGYGKAKQDKADNLKSKITTTMAFSPQVPVAVRNAILDRIIDEILDSMKTSKNPYVKCKTPAQLIKKVAGDIYKEEGGFRVICNGKTYTVNFDSFSMPGIAYIHGTIKSGMTSYVFGGTEIVKDTINAELNDMKDLANSKIDEAYEEVKSEAISIMLPSQLKSFLQKVVNDKTYSAIKKMDESSIIISHHTNIANLVSKALTFANKANNLKKAYDDVTAADSSNLSEEKLFKKFENYNSKREEFTKALEELLD